MADRLSLYNGALLKLGQPRLATVSDECKARRSLDAVYDKTIKGCLEAGYWNFSLRFAAVTASPSLATNVGYRYVFEKPDDWLRTSAVTTDAYGLVPLLEYDDRAGYWLADFETIYIRFVSNDQDYGLDLGRWPESFVSYVEYALAAMVCEDITGSNSKLEKLEKDRDSALKRASSSDAMNEAVTKFPPPGRLVRSRMSGTSFTSTRRCQ